jgi:hypothetical protein
LQEFFVTVVKKAFRPLSAAQALEWIEQSIAFPGQSVDHQLVRIAVELSERHKISYGELPLSRLQKLWGLIRFILKT